MLDWNDFKKVFVDIEPNRVVSIFPTVSIFLEFGIGERDESDDLKLNFLRQATHVANAEYQDYRRANPEDVEAKGIYLKYQIWISSILIELEKRIALSKGTSEKPIGEKKYNSDITHTEVVIAMNYIVMNLKDNSNLPLTDIVRLLYYLRKEEIPNKIENTSEYKQYSTLKTDSRTGADKKRKDKAKKVATFLNSIGLSTVANQLLKDYE
jgi:hypothetical protein